MAKKWYSACDDHVLIWNGPERDTYDEAERDGGCPGGC
jgi:hypothetical protein